MGEIWIHLGAVKMEKNNQPKEQVAIRSQENQKTVHRKSFSKEGNPVDTFQMSDFLNGKIINGYSFFPLILMVLFCGINGRHYCSQVLFLKNECHSLKKSKIIRHRLKRSKLCGLQRLSAFNTLHGETTQRKIYNFGCHGDY